MTTACQRVAWCVLQAGHGGACRPTFAKVKGRFELAALLMKVEVAMTNSPRFNPWDLGPSKLLLEVREAIGKK